MSFDPYHKWLGVPPAEQPPNHYRLLGIALFERDSDVIEGAADRQMAHVRTFQSGQHSALSQQILNELAAAKLCLLSQQKKADYDADLRRRLNAGQAGQPRGRAPRTQAFGAGSQNAAPAPAAVADAECPDVASLSDFALGKLEAPAAERISRHLDVCAACRQQVAEVPGDGFVDPLRAALQAHEQPANPGRTVVDREAADGLETTIDHAKSPARGHKPRPAARVQPELQDHPDYEIVKELGRGGMGVVYLARNRLMDRLEVLKVLNQSLLERPGALERFQQEIRSAAKLSHINIVAAYAVLRMSDSLVFAMEYVPGQDLAQVVARRGPLRVPNAAYYAHQAALGLEHAHEKGMVHRDIKPNNLMLAVDGKKHIVKVLDFGLAKATSEKNDEAGLTKTGQILGTPDYLAPEQSRNAQRADIRADIYSLGCTLYFFLSGKRPFPEASLYDVLDAHQRREATPLDQVRPEVPPELAAIVAKMMAKSPADRYQRPVEVAKALVPFFKPGASAGPPVKPRDEEEYPQHTVEYGAASEQPVANESPAAPAAWPAPQAAFPLLPPRAVPVAVPLPKSAFDTSIDFESPLIDTDQHLQPTSRPWRLYLATCLAAVALMLCVAMVLRAPRGTVEVEPSDAKAGVTVSPDSDHIGNSASDMESPGRSEGFTALFNGKDLSGWKPHPAQQEVWRVEKGILIGSGEANSYLVSERGNFTNFHLRVEARVKDRGDSGVYFRARFGADLWPSGYEAQINAWEDERTTGSLFGWGSGGNVRVTDSAARPNEWFTLEVIATDNHLVVKVNGLTTASYIDAGRRFPMGHIGLEKYRRQTVVEFRKVEIKEFGSAAGPSE